MYDCNATVAASLATIEVLQKENPYERMFQLGKKLMNGLRGAALQSNQNLLVQGAGPMFVTCFTYLPELNDYRDTLSCAARVRAARVRRPLR